MDGLEQVQVRFFTKQKQYAVTDAPTLVPVSLKRYGLSEIVNHLLGTSDAPTPFEFFIQGNVLRTSLGDYLKQAGLSTEHVLELEYAATVRPPTQLGSIPHDDWIGAVDMQQGAIVSGCYDGVVRVFNHSAELQRTLSDHEGPVTTVVMTPASRLFSGSHDQTIIEWDDNDQVKYKCIGHEKSVTSLAINKTEALLYSGSWDHTVKAWRVGSSDDMLEEDESSMLEIAGKRRKATVPTKSAVLNFVGHTGPVMSVAVDQQDPKVLYSAGWDQTIRSWDASFAISITTQNCNKPVNHMDYSAPAGLLATAHSDSAVRVWDLRAQDATAMKLTINTKQGWISSLSWSDNSPFMLACAAYDATIKVIDIRAQAPLYTVKEAAQDSKVLCCKWRSGWLVSGGEDSVLHIRSCA